MTPEEKKAWRENSKREIMEFLSRGGKIQQIPRGVIADDCYPMHTNPKNRDLHQARMRAKAFAGRKPKNV